MIRSRLRVESMEAIHRGLELIGEGVWIDNHGFVEVGTHCVLSQEVFVTTGSHEYGVQWTCWSRMW